MKVIALIVAAGSSERMQGALPKPYLDIGGKTVLKHCVETFLSHPRIDGVRVVIRRQDHPTYKQALFGVTLFPPVIGGKSRQDSVRLGLQSLRHTDPTHVLIHDAARPLVSHALIDRILDGLTTHDAVVPTLAIHDTIKKVAAAHVNGTIDRTQLHIVQTPQGFNYTSLLAKHEQHAGTSFTDDAALYEQSGEAIASVEGEPQNFKLTTPQDMSHFMNILALSQETRTGMGFDVHALKLHGPDTNINQQTIRLCGVTIPHTHYLEGHSDADVGLHAIVDALLGAISEGDIGSHFPPDDKRWKGADSDRFLLHAFERVLQRGGKIVHLDVTLICEQPKVGPHRTAMIKHIAQLLKLPEDRISVKATTTEKLGFTGRGEGIAAQAVATVTLPAAQTK